MIESKTILIISFVILLLVASGLIVYFVIHASKKGESFTENSSLSNGCDCSWATKDNCHCPSDGSQCNLECCAPFDAGSKCPPPPPPATDINLTHYWDCCKPACGWDDLPDPNRAMSCDSEGLNPAYNNDTSVCKSGGDSTMCASKTPFVQDDTLYAYVAGPPVGTQGHGNCGTCYSMDLNNAQGGVTKAIVKETNIGYDVKSNQLDLAVPGGGFGKFAGCSKIKGWQLSPTCDPNGDTPYCKQYGGLSDIKYCDIVFPGDLQSAKACKNVLFGVFPPNDGAGYPAQLTASNRKVVECPSQLQ